MEIPSLLATNFSLITGSITFITLRVWYVIISRVASYLLYHVFKLFSTPVS